MSNRSGVFPTSWWRDIKQDIRVFVHLFPWRTALFLLLVLLLTSFLFYWAYIRFEDPDFPPQRAFFAVINLTFFQVNYSELPHDPRLDFFTVFVPLVGLPLFSLLGLRVLGVIRIFFLRNERGQEWQEALIESTIANHILVCGLGRIGYRVAAALAFDYQQQVVGINDQSSALVDSLLARGLPVIIGDVENEEVLKKSGIEHAIVVVVCTNHDWINLSSLVRIRRLNPRARIVLRLFDDELAGDIRNNFGVDSIISRSAVAALSFAYAAVGGTVLETFNLGIRNYVLSQLTLVAESPLLTLPLGQLADEKDVTIVAHHNGRQLTVEPAADIALQPGDTLFVFATIERMLDLIEDNSPVDRQTSRKGLILVCGLGHTGFRITANLLRLGCRVVAMDFQPGRLAPRLQELGVDLKFGDMRWGSFLEEAGIGQATSIVTCTDDDMMNLQIALRARRLNPHIRVVMRIFDDELSGQLRRTFHLDAAYSTSALAAPDFVSAALNRINVRRVDIEGISQVIVRLRVTLSALFDLPVPELNAEDGVTVLLQARGEQVDIPFREDARLKVGDEIVILTTDEKLANLNQRNKEAHQLKLEGYSASK
jgi:Trk K+ transport system NAD-binding subunit